MRLKKDGTPAKKPGRKPDPTKVKIPGPGRSGPRPHVWHSGPDEFKHSMYMPWMRSKAQANFRNEVWSMTFEEFYELWKDQWHERGRGPDDVCMTRNDPDGPWDKANTIIVTRYEHLLRQSSHRASQGMKYYKKGPPGRPAPPIKYKKIKV